MRCPRVPTRLCPPLATHPALPRNWLFSSRNRAGFQCTVAQNAPSAVVAATGADRFALMFLDVSSSGGGGDGAARLIRAFVGPTMDVPIIATTDYDKTFLLADCFDDMLLKPFSREEVLRKLEQLAPLERASAPTTSV